MKKNQIFKIILLIASLQTIITVAQLTLTIRIHLIRERPNPEMAPYLPAAEVVRQKDRKNPIQLKRNATVKAKRKKEVRHVLLPKEQECPKGALCTCFCLNGLAHPPKPLSHFPKTSILCLPPKSKQENTVSGYQVLYYYIYCYIRFQKCLNITTLNTYDLCPLCVTPE